jgi:hypothetical protein
MALRGRWFYPNAPGVGPDRRFAAVFPAHAVLRAGLVLDHFEDLAPALGGPDLLRLNNDAIADIRVTHTAPPNSM